MGKSLMETNRAIEHFHQASESAMERRARLTRTHVRIATAFSWILFLVCLAAAGGVFAVCLADGPVVVLGICAAVVAIGTFTLIDHTILWACAGRCARRAVELSGKREADGDQD